MMVGETSPIFVGGVPRSGTTLTRVILDTHSRIFCGTELRVVQALTTLWSSAEEHARPLLAAYNLDSGHVRKVFADLILSFMTPAWRASGKPRLAEKTPSNLLVFPELRRLFPHSPLIHVVRDVRDVVASRLQRADAEGVARSVDRTALAAGRAREWANGMAIRRTMLGDSFLARYYHEFRYEDLIAAPEPTLKALFAFLDERFEPEVLEFHRVSRNVSGTEEWSAEEVRRPIFTTSVGRWQQHLSAQELRAVMFEARDALIELGYVDA